MNDMSEGALRRFYIDLDADNRVKDGVVIDVRNNNGGFVNVYAIDVLARRGYLMMTPRGLPTAPARSMLGQRALELPTILVTNQHSLSDAEDFTEGYRTLKLGKIVGEPTSGWIIYTGSQTLVDGSTMRMPETRITTLDGKTMELNPRPVDIAGDAADRRESDRERHSARYCCRGVAAAVVSRQSLVVVVSPIPVVSRQSAAGLHGRAKPDDEKRGLGYDPAPSRSHGQVTR